MRSQEEIYIRLIKLLENNSDSKIPYYCPPCLFIKKEIETLKWVLNIA